MVGCKWVYDLWDHPTLGYASLKGPARWVRRFIWFAFKRWVLNRADAWIIAMHPAILGHLPPAPVSCHLIFNQPGYIPEHGDKVGVESADRESGGNDIIRIVYAGPVSPRRGLRSIMQWAAGYRGATVELNIIGPCIGTESKRLMDEFKKRCGENRDLSLRVWGELTHSHAMGIILQSHIGLCPLDISILNYRFAYPIKVVEQMGLGLIVVATGTHGTRTFIDDGKNGVLAEGEGGAMSRALDRAVCICRNKDVAETMRDMAKKTLREQSWEILNSKLVKQLKVALGYSC